MKDFGFVEDTVDNNFGFVEDRPEPISMDAAPQERDMLTSFSEGVRDAAGMGFGNQISAGIGAGIDVLTDPNVGLDEFGRAYSMNLQDVEQLQQEAKTSNPDMYTTGQVAGTAGSMVLPIGAPARVAGKGLSAVKGAGDALVKNASHTTGKVAKDAANYATKTLGLDGGKITSAISKADPSKVLPQTMYELGTGAAATAGGGPLAGALTVAGSQYAKKKIGGAVKRLSGAKDARYLKGEGTKIADFNKKYGDWMNELAARGTTAVTANVFIRQQQDPSFNAALKEAKAEAEGSE